MAGDETKGLVGAPYSLFNSTFMTGTVISTAD